MNKLDVCKVFWQAGQRNDRNLVGLMDVLLFLERHGVEIPDSDWDQLSALLDDIYGLRGYTDERLWYMPLRQRPVRKTLMRQRTTFRWGM